MDTVKPLVNAWIDAKLQLVELEKKAKEAKRITENLERRVIENMDIDNITSIKIDGLGTFTLRETLFCSINEGDLEKAGVFFADLGIQQEMFKSAVKKGRLNEYAKEQLASGKTLPDFIKHYIKRALSSKEETK